MLTHNGVFLGLQVTDTYIFSFLSGLDNWIVCEEDGLWSTPRAHCLVTCPPPLHVQHVRRQKKRCRTGSVAVGSRCKMRCKKGYRVAGARRATRYVNTTSDDLRPRVITVTCLGVCVCVCLCVCPSTSYFPTNTHTADIFKTLMVVISGAVMPF